MVFFKKKNYTSKYFIIVSGTPSPKYTENYFYIFKTKSSQNIAFSFSVHVDYERTIL